MAITRHGKYLRITRAWDGAERQLYVPIRESYEKALKEAEAIDSRLERAQKAYTLRKQLPEDRLFHSDGTIVGLQQTVAKRKGRKAVNIFKLRCNIPNNPKPLFTTISIDKHGFEEAFRLAVDKVCEWNGIDKGSIVRQMLFDTIEFYKAKAEEFAVLEHIDEEAAENLGTVSQEGKLDAVDDDFERGLLRELGLFEERRDVIRG